MRRENIRHFTLDITVSKFVMMAPVIVGAVLWSVSAQLSSPRRFSVRQAGRQARQHSRQTDWSTAAPAPLVGDK